MNPSTTRQLELNYEIPVAAIETNPARSGSPTKPEQFSIRPPNFDISVYAAASRRAGRINAAAVSDKEHKALLSERQSLLDRKFDGGLTAREGNRLEYVRWSLDRIEDAKYGQSLDQLESVVESYERFHDDLEGLHQQLTAATRRGAR